MKVLVNYSCELEDIPKKVAELLENLEDNDLQSVALELENAKSHSYEKNITETFEAIDRARVQLSKIDNSLMDYGGILAGYSKTIADIQLGNDPAQINQEENNVDSEAKETNDQAS
tara:strand:- start:242 stop:589 length:348 start_codon:yes stop_codon:yes gene_type:complete